MKHGNAARFKNTTGNNYFDIYPTDAWYGGGMFTFDEHAPVEMHSSLSVGKAVTLASTLSVGAPVTLASTLSVGGPVTLASTLNVNGNAGIGTNDPDKKLHIKHGSLVIEEHSGDFSDITTVPVPEIVLRQSKYSYGQSTTSVAQTI